VCRQRATYCWNSLDEGYNFALNLVTIGGLHRKLCAFKVAGVPTVENSGLPLGSPKTKNHLDVATWRGANYTIRGKVVASPKSELWWILCPSYSWFVLAPKVLILCTNHYMLVLCRSVWVSEAFHFFLVPSQSSSMLLYPSVVLQAREQPRLLALPLFSIWDWHLSPLRS
jgi:hypothetical protein